MASNSSVDVIINLIARDLTGTSMFGFAGVIEQVAQNMLGAGASAGQLATATAQLGAEAGTAWVLWQGLSSVLETAIGDASNLQYALTQVSIATQSSADALPDLTDAINTLAIDTIYGSDETADAFARMSESGFTVSQILYGINAPLDEYKQHAFDATEATQGLGYQALVMSQAMGGSAVDGATLLGAAMHVFADQGLSATQTANLLAGAFFNGVPSITDMTMAIQQGGATADLAGASMQDYLTTIDLLAQNGVAASAAGSSLNYVLRSMTEPTAVQAQEFASLGLMIVNTTVPAYKQLESSLISSGAASADQVKNWDGSVAGLQQMYYAAQSVGQIPLDTTFSDWALQTGLLNNKFYDAQGQFIGLKAAVDAIDKSLAGKPQQEKLAEMEQMFNIKSGRAAAILTNLQDFDTQYEGILNKMTNTDVTAAAQKQLDTFKGATDAFKDSLSSALAVAIMPFLAAITPLFTDMNNLLQLFMQAPPWVQEFAGGFLIAATALAGLSLVVVALTIVVGIFTAVGVILGPVLGGIAAVIGIVIGGGIALAAAFVAITQNGEALKTTFKGIGDFLGVIGAAIGGAVQGAMSTLVPLFQSLQQTAGPALKDMQSSFSTLGETFQKYEPQLQAVLTVFKVLFGAALLATIATFVGFVAGSIGALVGIINGLVMVFAGLGSIISGVLTFITALIGGWVKIIEDVMHGNWGAIWNDATTMLGGMASGIGQIISGLVAVVVGLLTGLFGTIIGAVQGFIGAVIGFFQNLFDKLVGHSIIPDLVNGVISWFQRLPGAVLSALGSMVTGALNSVGQFKDQVMTSLDGLLGQVLQFGQNLVGNIAQGIRNGLGNLQSALSQVGNTVKNAVNNIPGLGGIASHLGFASGGTVPATGMYWVGEQGPELMALPGGAQVYNNYDSMRYASQMNGAGVLNPFSGSMGGQTTHVVVQIGNETVADHVFSGVQTQLRIGGMGRLNQ